MAECEYIFGFLLLSLIWKQGQNYNCAPIPPPPAYHSTPNNVINQLVS
jgi:hypothetical protein